MSIWEALIVIWGGVIAPALFLTVLFAWFINR